MYIYIYTYIYTNKHQTAGPSQLTVCDLLFCDLMLYCVTSCTVCDPHACVTSCTMCDPHVQCVTYCVTSCTVVRPSIV